MFKVTWGYFVFLFGGLFFFFFFFFFERTERNVHLLHDEMSVDTRVSVHVGIWSSILRSTLILDSFGDGLREVLDISAVESGH